MRWLLLLSIVACGGSSDPIVPTPDAPASPSSPTTPSTPTTPTTPTSGAPASASDYFPPATGAWETVSAADAGFDQTKLDELVTQKYNLDDINEAMKDLRAGRNIRGVIAFD